MRAYTVAEIDRMRAAIGRRVSGGMNWCVGTEAMPRRVEEVRQTEDQLRTYMLAGVSPEELEAEFARPAAEGPAQDGAMNVAIGTRMEELPAGFVSWGGPHAIGATPIDSPKWTQGGTVVMPGWHLNPDGSLARDTPLESERDCGCPAGECQNRGGLGISATTCHSDDGTTHWSCGRVTRKG